MEVQFTPDVQAQLNQFAASQGKTVLRWLKKPLPACYNSKHNFSKA